jgi:predicted nucleic acid-binding protein
MIVFIDSNTLGLIANPHTNLEDKKYNPDAENCQRWFANLLRRSVRFVTSDICDYEIRRGLVSSVNSGKDAPGLELLNFLKTNEDLEFLPVTSDALELAANLWAEASSLGKQTSDSKNIDADMIISAQYQLLRDEFPGQKVIVATTNLKHLSIFCEAAHWRDIKF